MSIPRQTSQSLAQVRAVLSFLCVLLGVFPALFWFLAAQDLERMRPTSKWVTSVTVQDKPNLLPVVLGRQDLGQRAGPDSASTAHLLVNKDADGWWVQNIAINRKVLLLYETPSGVEQEYHARRFPLREGDIIKSASGASLRIDNLKTPRSKVGLVYERKGQTPVEYSIAHQSGYDVSVETKTPTQAAAKAGWLGPEACKRQRPQDRFSFADLRDQIYGGQLQKKLAVGFEATAGWFASTFNYSFTKDPSRSLLRIGGVVSCSDRLAFADLPPGALWLDLREDAIFLGGTAKGFDSLVIRRPNPDNATFVDHNLANYRWPAQGVHPHFEKDLGTLKAVYLGRTRYAVETGETFALKAVSKIQKFLLVPEDSMPDRFLLSELECMTGGQVDNLICDGGLPAPSPARDEVRKIGLSFGTANTNVFRTPASTLNFIQDKFNWLAIWVLPLWGSLLIVGAAIAAFAPTLAESSLVQRILLGTQRQQSEQIREWLARAFSILLRICCLVVAVQLLSALRGIDPSASQMIVLLTVAWCLMTLAFACDIAVLGARGHTVSVVTASAFWFSLGALLAIGSLTLHLLGTGSANSLWEDFGSKHHAGLMMLFAGLAFFLSLPTRHWRALMDTVFTSQSRLSWWLRVILAIVILLIAAIMFAVGSEAGLFGVLQPSEINKFALVAVLGVLFVSFDQKSRYARTSQNEQMSNRTRVFILLLVAAVVWLANPEFRGYAAVVGGALLFYFLGSISLFWFALFCLASFFGVPAALQDFSPIVISVLLLGMLIVFAFFQSQELKVQRVQAMGGYARSPYQPGHRRFATGDLPQSSEIARFRRGLHFQRFNLWLKDNGTRALAIFGLLVFAFAVVVAVAYALSVAQQIAENRDILDFDSIQRRFAVYLDRETYIEWGEQLRRAWAVLDQNAALSCGWPFWPCLAELPSSVEPLNASEIMNVPAIQDDLISAFFVARFGTASMVLLVAFKLLFVATGMIGAFVVFRRISGHLDDEISRLFLSIVTFGAVCLFAVHWCIAWANLMGWFPIMGQPMTFISYARSHMLGMGLPALVAILLALRIGPPIYIRQW